LKIRRLAIAGVAVFAAAGLMAGCASKNGTTASASPSVKPSPTVAPKVALLASATSLASSSYKFTVKSAGLNGDGAADPANKMVKATATGQMNGVTIKLDFIQISNDLYAKLDLGPLTSTLGIQTDKYYHADASKLSASPGSSLPFGDSGQPIDAAGMLAGINDVQTTDGKHFTGTIDATKMTGDFAPDSDALKKAGDKAKSIPFTATLDDQGRLTDLNVNGSSIDPALAIEVSVTDYGSATGITKPDSSQVIEAPDSVLQFLQG
jgi:hypothetical protein